jgi:putative PIN family toxin of toxin-antitoxin system
MRVVLDTSVLVAALRSRRGASFEVLSRVGPDEFEIALSVPVVFEYEDALMRHLSATELVSDDIGDLIDYLCSVAVLQDIFFLWRPQLRNPGDDHVFELAVAAGCNAIITHSVRDFAGAERFGVRVLTPGSFVQLLRSRT